MHAKRKLVEQVAKVMATGLEEMTAEVFDAALFGEPSEAGDAFGDSAAYTYEPTVTEEPGPAVGAAVEAIRPTVGVMVQSLLMDATLDYEAIVAAVLDAHPGAKTTARSVASTACVMRKKGTSVPMRGRRTA